MDMSEESLRGLIRLLLVRLTFSAIACTEANGEHVKRVEVRWQGVHRRCQQSVIL